jgi:hypothetical protein
MLDRIKGTVAWDGFLSQSILYSLIKNFSICIIIYWDMQGFNSLSAVGECAMSPLAHSPKDLSLIPRHKSVRLVFLRA